MPTPQKTAKKAAKKVAKKVAKKAAKKTAGHHPAKDLRRAYEHMGRLLVLRPSLKPSTADAVAKLTRMAQQAIDGEQNKDAADLLRASEHLSFADLAGDRVGSGRISAELEQSITEQFDELMRKAEEHWKEHGKTSGPFFALYKSARENASTAFDNGAYHQALEFARAAEALAHVKQDSAPKLASGPPHLRLKDA